MTNNNMMYFWRVVFTYLIATHHFIYFFKFTVGWYIAVEFFAILSGYLLMQHINNHPEENVVSFIKKKFLYFCPIVFFSALIRSCVDFYYSSWTLLEFIKRMFSAIPEYLLLNGFYAVGPVNAVDWYIQCLFILCIPLYVLLKKYPTIVQFVIAPVLSLSVYSFIMVKYHCLQGYMYSESIGVIGTYNIFRILAGLLVGIMLHNICQKTKKSKSIKLLIAQFVAFLSVICLPYCISAPSLIGRNDFIYLIIIIGIACAFLYNYNYAFFSSNIIKFLSKISIYIYLNHFWCCIIFKNNFTEFSLGLLCGYYFFITIISVLLSLIITKKIFCWKRKTNFEP